MLLEENSTIERVNARKDDAFDLFNFRHFSGPNPYLNTSAFVFDFALTNPTASEESQSPRSLETYIAAISDEYPHLGNEHYDSYAHLFARTVAQVSQLEMDLHFDRWAVHPCPKHCSRIAVQSLHQRTSRAVIYCVWDWFEAITRNRVFYLEDQVSAIQEIFRRSVYGGPTIYALFKTAYQLEIPALYLWHEGLMQYGYGKKQVRGSATTFNVDSHLDSDFTTRKDDCKAFLQTMGFPVPQGEIVVNADEAVSAARRIGYPVAVKPVVGHKGNGVTADIQGTRELEDAFEQAVQAIPPEERVRIIVEQSITGKDYRLLCVNGRFVAATERQPASVIGDGHSTVEELIEQENRTPHRSDTPTSPMSKIKTDASMLNYLKEQNFSLDSILEKDKTLYLRKVANLSAGGVSIDATHNIHPDNIVLAQDIAQSFQLTCLGIDVIAQDLAQSWKQGNFAILEINAAPGVFMHLRPAVGNSVDVPAHILKTFFNNGSDARIPIITLNQISVQALEEIIDHILLQHPDWVIGGVCRDAVFVNRSQKRQQPDYNTNVQNLLRHPKLDLLIAEYPEAILEKEGMFYFGSNLVVLNDPTPTEMILARDLLEGSIVVTKQQNEVTIQRQGLIEQYQLSEEEPFSRVYLKELATLL